MKYNDDSLMPWGQHRNKPLSEVPDVIIETKFGKMKCNPSLFLQ